MKMKDFYEYFGWSKMRFSKEQWLEFKSLAGYSSYSDALSFFNCLLLDSLKDGEVIIGPDGAYTLKIEDTKIRKRSTFYSDVYVDSFEKRYYLFDGVNTIRAFKYEFSCPLLNKDRTRKKESNYSISKPRYYPLDWSDINEG